VDLQPQQVQVQRAEDGKKAMSDYEAEGAAMRLINADGGDAEISGNGLRCLAAYVFRQGWLPARHVVRTAAGPRIVEVAPALGSRYRVVIESNGKFDGKKAAGTWSVLPGSGEGDLEGITGKGRFEAPLGGKPSYSLEARFKQ
jgi:hypothetical protein